MLEARLSDHYPGKTIRVINQGREWFTTQHSLINYETRARALAPDLVIVMHAINDFMVNADHSYYAAGEFREDYAHHTGPLTRVSRNRSLFRFAAEVFGGVWYHKDREALEIADFPGLRPFERNLERLAQLAELDGAGFVLMTQPNLYKDSYTPGYWSLATSKRGMDVYNDTIRRVAGEKGLPLVDLERAVPKTLEFLADDCHYRPAAMPLIADEAAAVIGGVAR